MSVFCQPELPGSSLRTDHTVRDASEAQSVHESQIWRRKGDAMVGTNPVQMCRAHYFPKGKSKEVSTTEIKGDPRLDLSRTTTSLIFMCQCVRACARLCRPSSSAGTSCLGIGRGLLPLKSAKLSADKNAYARQP